MEELFSEISPSGPTPIGECLEKVTQHLLKDIEKGKPHKKTNYLVVTDGRASEFRLAQRQVNLTD